MLNAVVAGLVNDDLLDGFKRVEVELLRHQSELTLGIYHVLLQVVAKDVDLAGGFYLPAN
ncbi:Uncharacterised protein [Raoultella planticola]|uniref:Uncharacterized protein n=1 Tax=Raoultella planticola TaxID=575 RepID=A0A485B2M1_RAOPL|nr:Uncharacterised protein [Raoultella planticola]